MKWLRVACTIGFCSATLLAYTSVTGQKPSTAPGPAQNPGAAHGAAQHDGGAAGVLKALTDKALNDPSFDLGAAQDQLIRAGMTGKELSDATVNLGKTSEAAKAAAKKKREEDQNVTGIADWNIGQVYRGAVYPVSFPLTNHCRVPITATISYPERIPLSGPETVEVPAKTTVKVAMTLSFKGADKDIPSGPNVLNFNFQCVPEDDGLWIKHSEVAGGTKVTPAGTWTYVCGAVKQAYTLHLHLHWRPPSDKNDGGGGGGGKPKPPKKPASPTCTNLWFYNEFLSKGGAKSPADCRPDLAEQLRALITRDIPPFASRNPSAWSWVPDPASVDQMSVEEMLSVKARAQSLVTARGPQK